MARKNSKRHPDFKTCAFCDGEVSLRKIDVSHGTTEQGFTIQIECDQCKVSMREKTRYTVSLNGVCEISPNGYLNVQERWNKEIEDV